MMKSVLMCGLEKRTTKPNNTVVQVLVHKASIWSTKQVLRPQSMKEWIWRDSGELKVNNSVEENQATGNFNYMTET